MKKVIFTLLGAICFLSYSSATTYYWIGGGTTATTFAANASYTTDPITRTPVGASGSITIAATDVFVFDGTNLGTVASPYTGPVTFATGSPSGAFAQLKIINGANVTISRASAGTGTISLSGDGTAADDLVIDATSTLTLGGGTYDYNFAIVFATGATGSVSGKLYLSPISTFIHTRSYITCPVANTLTFNSGAQCFVNDSLAIGGFNSSVASSVTFKNGASLYYYTGRSPIGNNSTTQISVFDPGSNLYIMRTNRSYVDNTTAYASSNWSATKTFANIYIQNGSTFYCDGSVNKIDNLTIDAGSSFITHSSGQTPILGNLTVNGALQAQDGATTTSTNTIVMGGNTPQTISGTGSIIVPGFVVADNSDVTLGMNVNVTTTATTTSLNIFGKLNFNTYQILGSVGFSSRAANTAVGVTGDLVAGSYQITNVVGTNGNNGFTISGAGLSANTNVVGFSTGNFYINLSKPATATATGVALSFSQSSATLATSNPNGMDSTNGSVTTTGLKVFQGGTNYIINAATTKPVGISSGTANSTMTVGDITFNAAATTNYGISVSGTLTLNSGKLTIRSTDSIKINSGNAIAGGSFGPSKYIATDRSGANVGVLAISNFSSARTLPVGSTTNYLPVTLTPTTSDAFALSTFEGITTDGTANGTAMTAAQKAKVVDAVWTINRTSTNTDNCTVGLNWPASLEGSSFSGYGNSIGVARYSGSWGIVGGSGDNTTNTATNTFNSFSPFGVGQLGYALPVKLYNLSASEQQGKVKVQWNTEAETNVDAYIIERAPDGINFSAINNIAATGNRLYTAIDNMPLTVNYYRIKIIDKNGSIEYSAIVKVKLNSTKAEISVYPNPVKGNMVSLQLSNLEKGTTTVKVYNNQGQLIATRNLNYAGGNQVESIALPSSTAKGMYRLVVTNNQTNLQQTIMVD